MANKALFLKTNDTLLLGYVESNYDNDQLAALMYDTQQMYILPLLGTGLYDEIESQVINNTVSALNSTLLEKVRDALRMYMLADGQFVFTFKIRNKGVMTMSSDNSQAVTIDVLHETIRYFKDKAQVYAQRITNYLCENSTNYPLFLNPGNGVDTIRPETNSFGTGWNLSLPNEQLRFSLDNPSV